MTSLAIFGRLLKRNARRIGAVAGGNGTPGRRPAARGSRSYAFWRNDARFALVLVDPRRRGPYARRACADGGCERAGVPPPGPPLRGRARVLGDGQLRRAAPWER